MPRYVVTLEEKVTYTVYVDAPSEALANAVAKSAFAQSVRPNEDFAGESHGVEIVKIIKAEA